MKHQTISASRGIVHYWTAGETGSTVVFTHGATMDHDLFREQIESCTMRHRVITWDVPAHGLSRPYTGFGLKDSAGVLLSIADRERIDRFHMVGQSMGGFISQIVAFDYPQRVLSFVPVGSTPVWTSFFSAWDKFLLSATPAILRLYPYEYLVRTIGSQIANPGPSMEYADVTLRKFSKEKIAGIMKGVYSGLVDRDDHHISCPMLITYGQGDATGKVAAYSRRWADEQNAEIKIIPDARHNANMDNPQVFNKILEEFLRQVDSL